MLDLNTICTLHFNFTDEYADKILNDKRLSDTIKVSLMRYNKLMTKINQPDFSASTDTNFQKEFCAYYRINGAGKSEEWKTKYFNLFDDVLSKSKNGENVTFSYILNTLYNLTLADDYDKYDPSFSSKMLASINPNMPIWDSLVLRQFNVNVAKFDNPEQRCRLYSALVQWYRDNINSITVQKYINNFNEVFKDIPEFNDISDVKKLDSLFWATEKLLKAAKRK
ncbi:MAG: hypothetical protein ACI4VK_02080 [Candidatus Coproplasma sp.]